MHLGVIIWWRTIVICWRIIEICRSGKFICWRGAVIWERGTEIWQKNVFIWQNNFSDHCNCLVAHLQYWQAVDTTPKNKHSTMLEIHKVTSDKTPKWCLIPWSKALVTLWSTVLEILLWTFSPRNTLLFIHYCEKVICEDTHYYELLRSISSKLCSASSP